MSQLEVIVKSLPFFLIVFLPAALSAQEAEFTLNVNVDLVELSVTVLDVNERNVTGL